MKDDEEFEEFEPVDTSRFPQTLRVTFDFDREGVRVRSKEHVDMIAPASPVVIADEAAGAWAQLMSTDDEVLFRRAVYDPFQTIVEHHSPEGDIEALVIPVECGEFEVLLPLMDEAARGQLQFGAMDDSERVRPPLEFDLGEQAPDDKHGGRQP